MRLLYASARRASPMSHDLPRFGFTNPVLISDENEIIAGHGRVEAAKLLGLKEVPTLRLAHLTEAQRRAYVLADNKLAQSAGWDREILAIELQALIDLEFEVELTGFSLAEIDLVLDEAKESSPKDQGDTDDNVPALPGPEAAVARPGDMWLLGRHRWAGEAPPRAYA